MLERGNLGRSVGSFKAGFLMLSAIAHTAKIEVTLRPDPILFTTLGMMFHKRQAD
jgi:hypothetical protein